jgi:prepilin-type N-terminal cleavage/methylation domain-containing protein
MLIHRPQYLLRNAVRRAFTLVEMLVAVALVLLMMTMFAEIFTLATGSMSKQKGIAELDQRQRMTSTLLRADIQDRTFIKVYPFHPADSSTFVSAQNRPINIPSGLRQGYFYISENDPENDLDDVFQLTVTRKSASNTLFYGKAKQLLDTSGAGVFPYAGQPGNPNQPDYDDADVEVIGGGGAIGDGKEVGTSTSAEVAYFVRNGNLYRRVLLIRQPLTTAFGTQPMSNPAPAMPVVLPVPLMQPGVYPTGTTTYVYNNPTTFPNDFDYSATYDFGANRVVFLGQSELSNSVPTAPLSLGRPANRFGFNPIAGVPVEWIPSGFIGRFTQEETSNVNFAWPGSPLKGPDGTIGSMDDTNPYTRNYATIPLTPNGVVSAYANGPRMGEDILLTNVQCFDVKIWDPRGGPGPDGQPGVAGYDDDQNGNTDDISELSFANTDDGAWVDVGHTGAFGYFSQANNKNSNYGPLGAGNRCFDTWHPGLGSVGPPVSGVAPFRPALPGRDGSPGSAPDPGRGHSGDDDQDGVVDNIEELGWPNTDDIPIALKAIKIRVQYRDTSTGLVRDITIIEPLN